MIWVYRIALFVVATFAFVVLFDHGPANFVSNAQADFQSFVKWAGTRK